MTDHLLAQGDGHTELPEEDRSGLIPSYIATRGDLYDAEQRNITMALLGPRPSLATLLDDLYLRQLHRAMFGQVWEWAGQYRTRETNIGIAPEQISTAVVSLVNDAKAWVEHSTFGPDELATHFHHRLVAIHPFPNGNGRHGRIAADYLIAALGGIPFSWGVNLTAGPAELRASYRAALRHADEGDYDDLLRFVRS